MRYTRYSYKKKNSSTFMQFVLIIVISVLLGIVLFKLLFKNISSYINNSPKNTGTSTISNQDISEKKEFVFGSIQCGVFSSKDSAEAIKNTIPNDYPSFIVEENGKFKIMASVCLDSDIEEVSNNLTKLGINNYVIKYKINNKDDLVQAEIIDGCLRLINKLSDKDVLSIKTNEFKDWVNKISKDCSSEKVIEIKNKVNSLQEEFKKDNRVELMLSIYNYLSYYRI